MQSINRKEFLQLSAALTGTAFLPFSKWLPKENILLSFSTLGCPDWDIPKIISFAAQHGYKGIEVRGILRQMDLTQCPEFSSEQKRNEVLAVMKEKGLQFVNLGSSANMHISAEADRKKNLDEGRRYIDLARQLNCPFVRVFPNNFPKDRDKKKTMDLIAKGLKEMGDYAMEKNVIVLMETHGDLVYTADLVKLMKSVSHSNVGLVWDCCNMWTVTKEKPAYMYRQLKKYIRHTHIKDAKLVNGKPLYVLMGQGEVPIFDAVDLLVKDNYKGYYSFEWEKLWHPEIAEPEIAIADYPVAMKKRIKQ